MAGAIPYNEKPVGTYAEVVEMGLDPSNVGSCSQPSNSNKGCAKFSVCRYGEYRNKGVGPENIGCDVITSDGAAQVWVGPCFEYYWSGLDTRMKNMETSGEVINPRHRVGDTVKREVNVALHPTRDMSCPACVSNTCNKRKIERTMVQIQPFVRPGEQFKSASFAEELRQDARAAALADQRLVNLGGPAPQEQKVASKRG